MPAHTLRLNGQRGEGLVCIDEGFHNWPTLRLGSSWRVNSFTCRPRVRGGGDPVGNPVELFCFGPTGACFVVSPDRSVRGENVPVDRATRGASLGDSYFSGEGSGSYDRETNSFNLLGRRKNGWPRG